MLAVWLAVIGVILFVLYSYIASLKNLAPGPSGWPVVGCLFEIEPGSLHFSFDRWAKKYGPLILCKMAAINLFVISCPRLIKKAFAEKGYSDILNDRQDTFFAKYIMDDSKGVIFGKYGQTFIRLRKIMYKGLNLYGEGVQQFENMAYKELERLMKSITDLGGRDVDPKELLSHSLANMIGILLTGSMVNETDADLIWEYNNNANNAVEMYTDIMLSVFPFLRFSPLKVGQRYRRTMRAKKELLDKYFFSYKDTYVPGRERGLVDVLFKIQSQEKNVGDTQWLTDSQVKAFIQDIIFAGLITTRNGLLCTLLVLLHHHDCVDRMYQEIVDTVGLERSPSLKDRPAMPYTDAVILEALRYITHVPLAIPHGAMEDVELEGYTIPKGSRLIMNIWTVHHDPAIWGDPWIFRPERFLDDNGELLPAEHTMRQSLVTFGSGKRNCVGENLAKSRFFLYLTTLIQKFDLLLPKEGTVPSDDSRTFLPGGALRPQDYKMRFRVR
ncbi:hypothetical protein CHS0354_008330 [Potamilus streckersoni]|uniref:Cytochrome P450 n=1 Tax=Potamilus streckersoni TaxID=2493646 RepID=A0AAE0SCC1_9BIVA|nr:hypothetical protein CHS0354_008330 [Potamilus streckersoni]